MTLNLLSVSDGDQNQETILPLRNMKKEKPLRVPRQIVVSAEPGEYVDKKVVAFKFYNSFNYSMIGKDHPAKLIIGVTSANPSEGKTFIACNLAASLSLGTRMNTVLVDLDTRKPRLHEVFGISARPGLVDALGEDPIHVSSTKIDHLSVLAAGDSRRTKMGLGDLSGFQEILCSLKRQFEFVIVDMPSITSREFPVNFTNLLTGIIIVIDLKKTRRRDIDKVFRKLPHDNVLGFVFNRVDEDDF